MQFCLTDIKCTQDNIGFDGYGMKLENSVFEYSYYLEHDDWVAVYDKLFDPINNICGSLLSYGDFDSFSSSDAEKILTLIDNFIENEKDMNVISTALILHYFCEISLRDNCYFLIEC